MVFDEFLDKLGESLIQDLLILVVGLEDNLSHVLVEVDEVLAADDHDM